MDPRLAGALLASAMMAPVGALVAPQGKRLLGAAAVGLPAAILGAAAGDMYGDLEIAKNQWNEFRGKYYSEHPPVQSKYEDIPKRRTLWEPI